MEGLTAVAALAATIVGFAAFTLADHGGEHRPSGQHPRSVHAAKAPTVARGGRPSPRQPSHASAPAPVASPLHGRPIAVSITTGHPGPVVPSGFVGLSFEAAAIPRIATLARTGVLARLLRSLGPSSLRFGGISADEGTAFSPDGSVPRWASIAISDRDLAGLAALVRSIDWSVLLTVNLGHYDPGEAAAEVAAARALLGARLAGVEIGNEPDRFHAEGLRAASWNFPRYEQQFDAYRSAIAQVAPAVAFAAPDASSGLPVLPWVRQSVQLHPALITDHYYPLTACGNTPTVSELLSPVTRADENAMLASLAAIQRTSAIPLRIDETNNISCKGQPGVSNTFAAALWALDYICRAMAAGLDGLNFHDLLNRPTAYSPLVESGRSLQANPEWYALVLAHRLEGATPLQATVQGEPDLTAAAFRRPNGSVQLVLVNFHSPDSSPLRVQVRLPGAFADATILRLTAPSQDATSGVQLGGDELTPSGSWSPRAPLPAAYDATGSPELALAGDSAALVTLAPSVR